MVKSGTAVDDRVAFWNPEKLRLHSGRAMSGTKWKSVAFNPNAPNNAYLAMSSIANGMTDRNRGHRCLAKLLRHRVPIEHEWSLEHQQSPIRCFRGDLTHPLQPTSATGTISQALTICWSSTTATLLIGEDTRKHEYNTVWLWQEATRSRSSSERISTSNVTSLDNGSENLDAWSYEYRAEVSDLNDGMTYLAGHHGQGSGRRTQEFVVVERHR